MNVIYEAFPEIHPRMKRNYLTGFFWVAHSESGIVSQPQNLQIWKKRTKTLSWSFWDGAFRISHPQQLPGTWCTGLAHRPEVAKNICLLYAITGYNTVSVTF